MNPLIDASFIKVKLTERMHFVAQLFPKTYVTVQVPPELLEQAEPSEARALPSPDVPGEAPAPADRAAGLAVVMPQRIGIVKAWDFSGTRLHVEFALLNDTDGLVAIRNVIVLIGGVDIPDPQVTQYVPDAALFKQFVDVTPDARLPSRRRLPVVVSARTGLWLCAELESPIDVNFGATTRECSLFVALNSGTSVRCRFQVHGDSRAAAFISQMQETATQEKSAASLGLPIHPLD